MTLPYLVSASLDPNDECVIRVRRYATLEQTVLSLETLFQYSPIRLSRRHHFSTSDLLVGFSSSTWPYLRSYETIYLTTPDQTPLFPTIEGVSRGPILDRCWADYVARRERDLAEDVEMEEVPAVDSIEEATEELRRVVERRLPTYNTVSPPAFVPPPRPSAPAPLSERNSVGRTTTRGPSISPCGVPTLHHRPPSTIPRERTIWPLQGSTTPRPSVRNRSRHARTRAGSASGVSLPTRLSVLIENENFGMPLLPARKPKKAPPAIYRELWASDAPLLGTCLRT